MSTSTPESSELLRLYKCVVETGTGVLTAFAQHKLLATYNGTFEQFFDHKKHELFHLWHSKKLLCCECPPAGCNLKRTGHMDNWIFRKIYEDNGPVNSSHIRRNGREVVQVCLHKYVTQNTAIHQLDISAISFLLRNLITLLANETTSLDIITSTRNKIFHAYSSNCYPMTLLNTMWNELENALVDLTDPSYKWSTRQQIKYLRKVVLEKEEITALLSNVEKVLQEVRASSNNNNIRLIGIENRLENNAINHKDDIKQHTTKEASNYAAQAQQALSEKIQKTEENLQKEMKELKKSQDNSCQKLETQLHGTRSEIKDVSKNILNTEEKLLLEVQSSSNDNVRYLDGMETRIENNAVNHTDDIKQHTTEETSSYVSQAQQALSEKIQNTEENLQKEMKELKNSQDNSCQKLETQLHGTRSEINDVKKMNEKTHAMVMEMSKTIENLQLSVKCGIPANLFVNQGACGECPVLWYLKTPKGWNVDEIEATILQKTSDENEQFKVKFARKSSLIMFTTVAASILSDPGSFEDAVMSFLTKMIEDCDINTKIPSRVDVTLHILNPNEVSFSCELPPEVRHKHGSENVTCKVPNTTTDDQADQTEVPKKQGSELVRHDIAFLNADNENEIKWVQRAAFLMKDKLGIECAIPGKDYLCGVPLKKLDVYFQRFRTVIVTVTKDSHIASKYKINKFESSIVVELDYRKSIPVDLRNMQYINGTLCEHLWFSQIAKVILKRHPDIERRISKQQINEVPVLDCKSCISSASTAVYHKLTPFLNRQTQPVDALFCGSLITEPFIIKVCNQLAKDNFCDSILRWEKSTASTFKGQNRFIVFVFVSKYLKKCKPLEEFINKHRLTADRNLYSTKIEETESPLFIKDFTTDIGTLSMDPAEIAASIQTILKDQEPSDYLTEAELKKPHNPSSKVGNVLMSFEGLVKPPVPFIDLDLEQIDISRRSTANTYTESDATVLSYPDYLNIGTDDQHNSPMKKKKKKKKGLDTVSLDPISLGNSSPVFQDPHLKNNQDKDLLGTHDYLLPADPYSKGTELTGRYENPLSKDPYKKGKFLPGTQESPSPKGSETTE